MAEDGDSSMIVASKDGAADDSAWYADIPAANSEATNCRSRTRVRSITTPSGTAGKERSALVEDGGWAGCDSFAEKPSGGCQ